MPVVVMALLWVAFVGGVGLTVDFVFGPHVHERLVPLLNAHLAEESLEGSYHPLMDWLFVLYSLLMAVVVFGASGLVAAWGASASERRTALVAVAGVLPLQYHLLQVALGGTPPFRVAAVTVLLANVVGFLAGIMVSRRAAVPVA